MTCPHCNGTGYWKPKPTDAAEHVVVGYCNCEAGYDMRFLDQAARRLLGDVTHEEIDQCGY